MSCICTPEPARAVANAWQPTIGERAEPDPAKGIGHRSAPGVICGSLFLEPDSSRGIADAGSQAEGIQASITLPFFSQRRRKGVGRSGNPSISGSSLSVGPGAAAAVGHTSVGLILIRDSYLRSAFVSHDVVTEAEVCFDLECMASIDFEPAIRADITFQ